MADEGQGAPAPVSREAHDRVKHELEQEKARNKELEGQLAASRKVSRVESYLRRQHIPEDEIAGRVQLLSPHLTEIPMDDIEKALADDRFKPLVAAPTAPPSSNGEGEGQSNEPPLPPEGGFGDQPSPGGDSPPISLGKVGPGDAEYDAAFRAAQTGDHSKMQKLYDDDRVKEPTPSW